MNARDESEIVEKKEVEEELRRVERERVLNIQPLVIRLMLHSSSSSESAEGMTYNVKIQFTQMIIQEIDTIKTFIVEFLHRSRQHWCAKGETGPKATSINPMCIEESEEDEAKEHYFMEA
jgi:hypothetical protein